MRITLVLHPYGEKYTAGLGHAIYKIIEHILGNDTDNEYNVVLKGTHRDKPFSRDKCQIVEAPIGFMWLSRALLRMKATDVCVFFTPIMPLFTSATYSVVVAHDFSYKEIERRTVKEKIQRIVLHYLNAWAFFRADAIVAVSYATKKDIQKYFPFVPEERIHVIYNGVTRRCDVEPEKMSSIWRPFILFVGVLKPRKNVERLVKAYCLFKKKCSKEDVPQLVLCGKKGGEYTDKLIKIINEEGCGEEVVITGYVDDNELSWLYRNAHAFVFPSLFEGFGMPVIEAMQCGLPVVTSQTGALGEIAGDAALCVDPLDVNEITDALEAVSFDTSLRQRLIELGRKRSSEFTWEETGRGYCNVIKILMYGNKRKEN